MCWYIDKYGKYKGKETDKKRAGRENDKKETGKGL